MTDQPVSQAEDVVVAPLPMELAPRDCQTLRLLVRYSEDELPGHWTPLEDAFESWTIGHNNFDNDGEDRWQFVGWDWSQDHYLQAPSGTVIGWLPFHGSPQTSPAAGEGVREKVARAICDFEWDGSQPSFDRKPPGFHARYLAWADAILAALAPPVSEAVGWACFDNGRLDEHLVYRDRARAVAASTAFGVPLQVRPLYAAPTPLDGKGA